MPKLTIVLDVPVAPIGHEYTGELDDTGTPILSRIGWIPVEFEKFWFIDQYGQAKRLTNTLTFKHLKLINHGNCFKSEQLALKASAACAAIMRRCSNV